MNIVGPVSRILGLLAACFAFVGGAFIASAPAARADTVTWTLENFLFTDGGMATGSFDYDAVTNTFSAIDITTSFNATTNVERTYGLPTGQGNARVFDAFLDTTNTGTLGLGDSRVVFSLASPMTYAGGTIDLNISSALTSVGSPTNGEVLCGPNDPNSIPNNVACTISGFVRKLVAGSITATQFQTTVLALPEAAVDFGGGAGDLNLDTVWGILLGTVMEVYREVRGVSRDTLRLLESSDSAMALALTIPAEATHFSYDFLFSDLGDGDWLTLSFNGNLLWSLPGESFVGVGFQEAAIPIGDFADQTGELQFTLHSFGQVNAQIDLTNFRFTRTGDGDGAAAADGGVTQDPAATPDPATTPDPAATQTAATADTGTEGAATSSAAATVNLASPPAPPSVDSFSTGAAAITAGDTAILSWTTTGAGNVSIDGGASLPADGSSSVSPTATTTYTLTATGAGGTTTSSVTVTVNPAPTVVDSFSAGPATITAGEAATLTWATTNAGNVSINGSASLPADGSGSVNPTATTTYTLTATGAGGTATSSVTVTVNPAPVPPSVDSFAASPATITAGESTALTWTTTGAGSVSIDGGTSLPADGGSSVSPTATTTYTLTATGAGGTTTSSVTVTVNPAPVPPSVDSFAASPATVTAGEATALTWVTTGAGIVSINGGASLPADGGSSVSPTATTTYTLTATGASGITTSSVTVTVNPAPVPPSVDTFSIGPATIAAGETAALSWTTTGAGSVSINGGASLPADGVVTVNPAATTTYTLTATGAGGTATASMTITVEPAPGEDVEITRFEFRAGKNEWRIEGTSTIPGPGNTLTLYIGPTAPGPVILGTTEVDSFGDWVFREKDSSVVLDSTGTLSIQSSHGGSWEGISVE